MNLQFKPNATNEEKREALRMLEEKFSEQKTKKLLLIITPICVVISLLYLFLGNAVAFHNLWGEKITYGFNELDSLDGDIMAMAGLSAFAYVPFIIALILNALSLALLFKFSLNDKICLANLILSIVCTFLSILLFVGTMTLTTAYLASSYYQPNWGPVLMTFLIFFINVIPTATLGVYKLMQKQFASIKATLI